MSRRILIINIFGIGDVLFTTPLIRNIKNNFPDSFIGYICNQRTAPVLSANPDVDKIFIYEKDEYRLLAKSSKIAAIRKIFTSLGEIRNERFDAVIDLSLNKHASFLMWAIGIKKRIGFNYRNRSPFLTTKITLEGYHEQHVVKYYSGLLKTMGLLVVESGLEIFISIEDRRWAEERFLQNSLKKNDLIVGMVPGGGASWGKDSSYKRWPSEKYAQLADKIVEKFSAKIILMGDKNEEELCARVAAAMRQKPAAIYTQATVGQFAALLSKCRLAIVNDGGPLHVAVASGIRTVSIFGPVDEKVYGPYPPGKHLVVTKDIACRPCYRRFKMADCEHHNCLHALSVSEVFSKIEEGLERN